MTPEDAKLWLEENQYDELDEAVERPSLPELLAAYASHVTAAQPKLRAGMTEEAHKRVRKTVNVLCDCSDGWKDRAEKAESLVASLTKERDDALRGREHTQNWYARHYGKVEDWARKRLPDPWRNEFFNCVANGTWGHDDVGEKYMTQVGEIVPSGYFKMDDVAKQLMNDQTNRAEKAESRVEELEKALRELIPVTERGGGLGQVCNGCGRNSFEFASHPETCPVEIARKALKGETSPKIL